MSTVWITAILAPEKVLVTSSPFPLFMGVCAALILTWSVSHVFDITVTASLGRRGNVRDQSGGAGSLPTSDGMGNTLSDGWSAVATPWDQSKEWEPRKISTVLWKLFFPQCLSPISMHPLRL